MSNKAGKPALAIPKPVDLSDYDASAIVEANGQAFELVDGMPEDNKELLRTLHELRIDLADNLMSDPQFGGNILYDYAAQKNHYINTLQHFDIPEDVVTAQANSDWEELSGRLNAIVNFGDRAVKKLGVSARPIEMYDVENAMNTLNKVAEDPKFASGERKEILQEAAYVLDDIGAELSGRNMAGPHASRIAGNAHANGENTEEEIKKIIGRLMALEGGASPVKAPAIAKARQTLEQLSTGIPGGSYSDIVTRAPRGTPPPGTDWTL